MAVSFATDDPAALLEAFMSGIKSGDITTWWAAAPRSHDVSVVDPKLGGRAWFRAKPEAGALVFNLVSGIRFHMYTALYSYYHGQLVDTFLRHFGESFSTVTATAVAAPGDLV
jgi:hypothetical protein